MNSGEPITTDHCRGCGICVEICGHQVLELHERRARFQPGRQEFCIRCGQCVAVCPNGAMVQPGFDGYQVHALAPCDSTAASFDAFLAGRRSTRNFRDRPVPREVLQQVLDMAARAPMGFPPHTTHALVIDTREEMQHLLERLRQGYDGMLRMMGNPLGRAIIRLMAGREAYHALRSHVVPIARENNRRLADEGVDRYLYGAPALILFHADRLAVSGDENAHVVCTCAMLAAHSLGLGSTILGLIPPIVERDKDLRERYGIPTGHKVHTSLILGYPKYRFHRGLGRRRGGVRFA